VAFLATAVALDAGLVGRPFRLRLRSFVRLVFRTVVVVGTGFALSGIDLHLLQAVVVVLLSRNVPLDLSVRLSLEVTTLLLHLHFENAGVNLNGEFGHILQIRWSFVVHRDLYPDLFLQSLIELRGQCIVVLTNLGC
jgi:hypothetical protein